MRNCLNYANGGCIRICESIKHCAYDKSSEHLCPDFWGFPAVILKDLPPEEKRKEN